MDLSTLLNQGGAGLSTEDLIALQYSDSSEKLNKINNATFRYPSNTSETFHFFDIFIQLVLTIHDVDDEFGLQYTNTVIIGALRSCIRGLLQQEGFSWLLSYPCHLSTTTWHLLQTTSDTTFLMYLYGLTLGLKKQETVDTAAWTPSILQFLRVKVPLLTSHIWLNLCYLDEKRQDVTTRLSFLTAVETIYWDNISDMMIILEKGDATEMTQKLENRLSGTLLRSPFTHDEMVLSMMSLERLIRSHQATYPHLIQALNLYLYRQEQQETNRLQKAKAKKRKADLKKQPQSATIVNPLSKGILGDIPVDFAARHAIVQKGTQYWVQQMASLLPADFELYLKKMMTDQYPSEKKRVLDLVLVDWAARDPFRCHKEIIVDTLIALLSTSSYSMRSAPYYAWIQAFNLTQDDEHGSVITGYNIKTGAEINISQFNARRDVALVNGLGSILQQMTLGSTSASTKAWLLDCLRVASPDIIERYVRWLTLQLNEEFENKHPKGTSGESSFTVYLQATLVSRNVMALASHVVPTLLRTCSDHTLAWLTQKKTDRVASTAAGAGRILVEYFSEGTHLSSRLLVVYLLRSKSKTFMDTLLAYLRDTMNHINPTSKLSRSWFYDHFLGILLAEAAADMNKESQSSQPNVASQLYQQLLHVPDDFEWFFTEAYTGESLDVANVARSHLCIAQSHSILSVRDTGMAFLLQYLTQLDGTLQQCLLTTWMNLWTTTVTSATDMEVEHAGGEGESQCRRRFAVPIRWILGCIGLYDQAPALVKQMIEQWMKIGIESRISHGEFIVDTTLESQTFTEQIMDLFMLSDTPEADDVFDVYVKLCQGALCTSDTDKDEMVHTMVNTLIALTEELKLRCKFHLENEQPLIDLDTNKNDNREDSTGSRTEDSDVGTNPKNRKRSRGGKTRKLRRIMLRRMRQQMHYRNAKKSAKQNEEELQEHVSERLAEIAQRQQKQEQLHKDALNQSHAEYVQVNKALMQLVQRLLNFLLTVLSETDGNSLCPAARQAIRSSLIRQILLYEPLMTLKRLSQLPESIHDDVQMIIDISLDSIQKENDHDTHSIIQRITHSQ